MGGPETEAAEGPRRFETTLWTLVLRAQDAGNPHRLEALNKLISIYWKPVYFFVRRKGNPVDDAKELVQEFFTALVETDLLRKVEREKGKFRTFLLACLEHHLCDAGDRRRALKRGGGRAPSSLDVSGAESELPRDLSARTPESLYERAWALTVLERALSDLRREYESAGKSHLFDALKAFVSAGAEESAAYSAVAERLKLSEGAVRVAVHRARRRYAELIRAVVRHTLEDSAGIDDEVAELFRALR
ncbi:MAG: sigma-70 family RNA polymerase sigma factor [Planctomycetes bacterium]|nr:sigma-70 family RNA polymerase sigma factor [Planctomycetota bacterium]